MRVEYILENIKCNDKDVSAALSSVRLDDSVNGTRNQFKRAVAFLLPNEPVRNKKNRGHAQISYVSTPRTPGRGKGKEKGKWGKKASFKPITVKAGVELRYYKSDECSELTQEQQYEFHVHRNSNRNYKGIWSGKAPGSDKYRNG